MAIHQMNYEESYEIIKKVRPNVEINLGFEIQLRAYYSSGCDVYLAQQLLLKLKAKNLLPMRLSCQSYIQNEAKNNDNNNSSNSNSSNSINSNSNNNSNNSNNNSLKRCLSDRSITLPIENEAVISQFLCLSSDNFDQPSSKLKIEANGSTPVLMTPTKKSSGKSFKEKSHIFSPFSTPPPTPSISHPCCRLSRPGCETVRVIPPLRGLDREISCLSCSKSLFKLSSVIRSDLDLTEKLKAFEENMKENLTRKNNSNIDNNPSTLSSYIIKREFDDGTSVNIVTEREKQEDTFLKSMQSGDNLESLKFNMNNLNSNVNVVNTLGSSSINKKFSSSSISSSFSSTHLPPPPLTTRGAKAPSFFSDTNDITENRNTHNENLQTFSAPLNKSNNFDFQLSSISPRPTLTLKKISSPLSPQPFSVPSSNTFSSTTSVSRNTKNDDRTRWIARLRLLSNDSSVSTSNFPQSPSYLVSSSILSKSSRVVNQLAIDDELATSYMFNSQDLLEVEYLPWMGPAPFTSSSLTGTISCPYCSASIGNWKWISLNHPDSIQIESSNTNDLEPKFFIEKLCVNHLDVGLDATPCTTPTCHTSATTQPGVPSSSSALSSSSSKRSFFVS